MNRTYTPILFILIFMLGLAACDQDSGEPQAAAPTANNAPRAKVVVSEAPVFTHPSREAAIMFRLLEGDQVGIVGHTKPDALGSPWYQVGYGDQFGWIVGSQVEVTGDVSRTRLVELQAPPTVELPPTIDLAMIPTETPTPRPDEVFAVVLVDQAIARSQPTADAAQMHMLALNERLQVIGRIEADEQGSAYYLLARDGTLLGWVSQSDVTIEGDLAYVPLVEDALTAALPTEVAAMANATDTPPPTDAATIEIVETVEADTSPQPEPSRTPNTVLTAQAAPTATDFPSIEETGTTEPETTPTPTEIPTIREGIPAPLSMDLPEGWGVVDFLIPINTMNVQGDLAMSMYRGPLENGITGTIWVIYGFPNIIPMFSTEINLYGDAVQLLRSIIFDPETCTLGLGTQPGEEPRTYFVGGLEATGTIYSAAPCLNEADKSGFFAALQVENVNFAFFVSVEPVQPAENVSLGLQQLQTILDTVEFELYPPTAEPTAID